MATPTSRTLKYLTDEGWMACIVEKYLKTPDMSFGRRIDAFGFGDVLACRPGEIALVQTTSGAGAPARRRKLLGKLTEADIAGMDEKQREISLKVAANVRTWLKCGGIVMLISWSKMGKKGERKLWTERVETIALQRGRA